MRNKISHTLLSIMTVLALLLQGIAIDGSAMAYNVAHLNTSAGKLDSSHLASSSHSHSAACQDTHDLDIRGGLTATSDSDTCHQTSSNHSHAALHSAPNSSAQSHSSCSERLSSASHGTHSQCLQTGNAHEQSCCGIMHSLCSEQQHACQSDCNHCISLSMAGTLVDEAYWPISINTAKRHIAAPIKHYLVAPSQALRPPIA